jgi:hypothetical protein
VARLGVLLELAQEHVAAPVAGEDEHGLGPVLAGERQAERRAPGHEALEPAVARGAQRLARQLGVVGDDEHHAVAGGDEGAVVVGDVEGQHRGQRGVLGHGEREDRRQRRLGRRHVGAPRPGREDEREARAGAEL